MLRGHPDASLIDNVHTHRQPPDGGRPSYVGLTFLVQDDTMDELEIVRFLVHHQLPPLSKGHPEHYSIIVGF